MGLAFSGLNSSIFVDGDVRRAAECGGRAIVELAERRLGGCESQSMLTLLSQPLSVL